MKLKRLFVLSILSAFLMTTTAFATSSRLVDIGGASIGSTIDILKYHVLTSGGVDVLLGKTAGANIPLIAPENKAAIDKKYSKQNWSFGNYDQHKARIDANDMSEDAGATAVGGNILVYGVPFDLDTDGDPGSVFWKHPGGVAVAKGDIPPNPIPVGFGFTKYWFQDFPNNLNSSLV